MKIWWKHDDGSLEEDLKPSRNDGDASELTAFAFRNSYDVWIFTEPDPLIRETTFMDKVKDKIKGKKCDEEVDNSCESRDESEKDVHFDYSDEKRMNEFYEGFDDCMMKGNLELHLLLMVMPKVNHPTNPLSHKR